MAKRKTKLRFRTLRAALPLLGAGRKMLVSWTPAALEALIGLVIDVLWISAAVFVTQFAGQWILTKVGFEAIGIGFALAMGFFYLLVLLAINISFRTLNAAGLLVGVDMLGNTAELIRTRTIQLRYVERLGPNQPEMHLRFAGKNKDFILKLATLQFALHWLWIVVNCMLNATWFAILIPWPYFTFLFFIAVYAGITWLIAHKPFDFAWFEWVGTVIGVCGFSGTVIYMLLVHHWPAYPRPEIAWAVTFLIGFAWATEHTKRFTLPVVIFGGLVLLGNWLLEKFTVSFNFQANLQLRPEYMVAAVLAVVFAILIGIAIVNGVEEVENTHAGGH